MDDARWAEIEARRARNAHFEGLERAARKAATRKPEKTPSVVRDRPSRSKYPIHQYSRPIGPKTAPAKRAYVRKPRSEWKPRSGRPKTAPEKCIRCERPFRPRRGTIKDYPGTVYHTGHGYCRTCEGYRVKQAS